MVTRFSFLRNRVRKAVLLVQQLYKDLRALGIPHGFTYRTGAFCGQLIPIVTIDLSALSFMS